MRHRFNWIEVLRILRHAVLPTGLNCLRHADRNAPTAPAPTGSKPRRPEMDAAALHKRTCGLNRPASIAAISAMAMSRWAEVRYRLTRYHAIPAGGRTRKFVDRPYKCDDPLMAAT
jgi:hypothetical protein